MNKKFKETIIKIAREIRNDIYHGEYMAKYYFTDKNLTSRNEKGVVAAEIEISSTYLNYTITFYAPIYDMFKNKDYKGVVEIICHEICHLLTEPLYKLLGDSITNNNLSHYESIKEQQTQRITNIAMCMIEKKEYIKMLKNI